MDLKVRVDDLQYGMYIKNLDRPWTETTFLFQGFELETAEQFDELKRQCSYVVVTVPEEVTPPSPPPVRPEPAYAGSVIEVSSRRFFPELKNVLRHTLRRLARVGRREPAPSAAPAPKSAYDAYRSGGDAKLTPEEKSLYLDTLGSLHESFNPAGGTAVQFYEESTSLEQEVNQSRELHQDMCQLAQELLLNMSASNLEARLGTTEKLLREVVDSVVRNPHAMSLLCRLQRFDDYSYRHAVDAAVGLIAFGRQLGFDKTQLQQLGLGGLLHDIGLSRLPDYYVKHPGIFTAEEMKRVRTHVELGVAMLREVEGIPEAVVELVERHHERHDGSGYPKGLAGADIGMFGSMAAIVDTYFSIISQRPYAKARTSSSALRTIFNLSGKTLHPDLTEQFIQTIGIYPIGSLVELNNSEVGVVVRQSRLRRLRPTLLVVMDADRQMYAKPRTLDLVAADDAPDAPDLAIRSELLPGTYGIDPVSYFM